jgi:hypothetical protein
LLPHRCEDESTSFQAQAYKDQQEEQVRLAAGQAELLLDLITKKREHFSGRQSDEKMRINKSKARISVH